MLGRELESDNTVAFRNLEPGSKCSWRTQKKLEISRQSNESARWLLTAYDKKCKMREISLKKKPLKIKKPRTQESTCASHFQSFQKTNSSKLRKGQIQNGAIKYLKGPE